MPAIPIASVDQFKSLINSEQPIVVDFWAEWCGPCRMISPIFKKFADLEEFKGLGFYTLDVEGDGLDVIGEQYGLKGMPTFMLFHKGEKVDEVVGAVPDKLKELVANAVTKFVPEGPQGDKNENEAVGGGGGGGGAHAAAAAVADGGAAE